MEVPESVQAHIRASEANIIVASDSVEQIAPQAVAEPKAEPIVEAAPEPEV